MITYWAHGQQMYHLFLISTEEKGRVGTRPCTGWAKEVYYFLIVCVSTHGSFNAYKYLKWKNGKLIIEHGTGHWQYLNEPKIGNIDWPSRSPNMNFSNFHMAIWSYVCVLTY